MAHAATYDQRQQRARIDAAQDEARKAAAEQERAYPKAQHAAEYARWYINAHSWTVHAL